MTANLILTGDVNLMNVTDPLVPFSQVRDALRASDLVFSNLECCLCPRPADHSLDYEGFFADPAVAGEALTAAGIQAVGIANNVNYGEAAIRASIARLDQIGIAHAGAGANRAAARAPVILDRGGVRFGFLQRSSVYWPTNHEAGEGSVGIAVIRGHTAYQVPMHGSRPPANRRVYRHKSSPGPTGNTSSGLPMTLRRCGRALTLSWPRAIGVSAARFCTT
jgi:hypothetical protein